MVKGASIKFTSYQESVPRLLGLLKVQNELKKYDKIILKPYIKDSETHTKKEFLEEVLKFCMATKNPVSSVFIAEGADGEDTMELFENIGYQKLAEKYSIGFIDLNNTETEEVVNADFLKFEEIKYPKILRESCVISLTPLQTDEETGIITSLSNMLGAFPSKHYSGFFSLKKNKIRKWPIHYSIHDILKCKMPNFAVIDASQQGSILAGLPIHIDKTAANHLGKEWKSIQHLKLASESFASSLEKKVEKNPESEEVQE